MKKICFILASLLAISSTANAMLPGAYVGGGLGYGQLQNFSDATKISSNVLGGRAYVGYFFNKYLGIEAGGAIFPQTTYNMDDYYNYQVNYSMDAMTVMLKAALPLDNNDTVNLILSLGAANIISSVRNVNAPGVTLNTSNSIVPAASVGLDYRFTENVSAGFEMFRVGSKSGTDSRLGIPGAGLTTINLNYHFN